MRIVLYPVRQHDCETRLKSAKLSVRSSDELMQRVKQRVMFTKKLIADCRRRRGW